MSDPTEPMPPFPSNETLLRPATSSNEATGGKPGQNATDETALREPTARDAERREIPPTVARTLRAPTSAAHDGDAYAATLRAAATGPQGTRILQDRLVRSLDEAGESQSGKGPSGPLQPGSVIKDRFVLDAVLGKGGMGVVFGAIDRRKQEAHDPNPRVALKVLNADFQRHPQSFIALQREARKAQTLAHPNVVTVFDFDRDGDAVYMTMELLQGRTLDSMSREARGRGIGREAALPIVRGIADGLAYAHRKGIVHSDLKPGNVFIAEDGTAKILDFGIARAVPSAVPEQHKDVFDAGSLGAYTEAYATDEMVEGVDPHPADDMYALGIIAYELLTGFHPYQRHSAPTARKLGIRPAALKGLKRREARAIERCLSFDRRQRPQNAAEFLKAFKGVTALQKATLAATAVLALVAGYLWYQNYLETSPAIAFSDLPAQKQQQFRSLMAEGDEAWAFYEREHIPDALPSAISFYVQAYDVHPRNREAVAALERSADALLDAAGSADRRGELARNLQQRSRFFLQYPPVVEAAKQ